MARSDRICLRIYQLIATCLLTVVAGNACADTVYKVRLRDGSIAFTDRPPADATVLEKQQYDFPPPVPRPAKAEAPPRGTPATNAPAPRANETKDQKKPSVEEARQALAEARARLEKGREIIAGDFIGTANPKIKRHSPAYDERVSTLEKAVADAEKDLAEALQARDAGR